MALTISKTRTVLIRVEWPSDSGQITFQPNGDDWYDGDFRHTTFNVDPKVWKDMGKPDMLTLTVEPGDLLNKEEVDSGEGGG